MMKEPWFWRESSLAARAVSLSLSPVALLYDSFRRVRYATTRQTPAPAPVFCTGNATVGGVGKTPFAIMLANLLKSEGRAPHFLTRGYGGSLTGPVRVDTKIHDALMTGDEALLLAASAPTWIARNRAKGALAAAAAGAKMLIMDDGYQNPSLEKTLSILLSDNADPVGNGRLLPAGPLREPAIEAAARADALVYVVAHKNDRTWREDDGGDRPHFRAWLEPIRQGNGERVVAFCGIGRPQRFFDALARAGFKIAKSVAFPDHQVISDAAIDRLRRLEQEEGARLITTEKDYARLANDAREDIDIFPVSMVCDRPEALTRLCLDAAARFNRGRDG